MSVAAFDTLKLARSLRDKAKFSPEQAEGLADAISEVMQGDLATKADLRETEGRLRTEVSVVRGDLKDAELGLKSEIQALAVRLRADIEATKSELRQTELRLKAEIEASKAEVIKWMFGTIGFQTLVILGSAIALARLIAK